MFSGFWMFNNNICMTKFKVRFSKFENTLSPEKVGKKQDENFQSPKKAGKKY